MLPSAKQYLAAWGIQLDSLQKAFLDVFTNRMAKNTSDGGQALIEEFDLPNDERFTFNKWYWSTLRGTKEGVFEMMNLIGHPNVSIYNSSGERIDSPFMKYNTSNFPTNITSRYQNINQFPQLYNFNYGTEQTGFGGQVNNSGFAYSWYVVVVWDMVEQDSLIGQILGNTALSSFNLGYDGKDYTYQGNQTVLADVARWGGGINSVACELILCYPNTINGQQSIINSNADPNTLPTTGNAWQGDVIERISLDIDNYSIPMCVSQNPMVPQMFGNYQFGYDATITVNSIGLVTFYSPTIDYSVVNIGSRISLTGSSHSGNNKTYTVVGVEGSSLIFWGGSANDGNVSWSITSQGTLVGTSLIIGSNPNYMVTFNFAYNNVPNQAGFLYDLNYRVFNNFSSIGYSVGVPGLYAYADSNNNLVIMASTSCPSNTIYNSITPTNTNNSEYAAQSYNMYFIVSNPQYYIDAINNYTNYSNNTGSGLTASEAGISARTDEFNRLVINVTYYFLYYNTTNSINSFFQASGPTASSGVNLVQPYWFQLEGSPSLFSQQQNYVGDPVVIIGEESGDIYATANSILGLVPGTYS